MKTIVLEGPSDFFSENAKRLLKENDIMDVVENNSRSVIVRTEESLDADKIVEILRDQFSLAYFEGSIVRGEAYNKERAIREDSEACTSPINMHPVDV